MGRERGLGSRIGIEDELIDKILTQLGSQLDEKATCDEVVDPVCTNSILTKFEASKEQERIRREIAEAFIVSSWTQRVYFDVRSIIMTIFGAIITLLVFWRVGTVDVLGDFVLGLSTYFLALFLSRLLDLRIVKMSRSFLEFTEGHSWLRGFIVKHF